MLVNVNVNEKLKPEKSKPEVLLRLNFSAVDKLSNSTARCIENRLKLLALKAARVISADRSDFCISVCQGISWR